MRKLTWPAAVCAATVLTAVAQVHQAADFGAEPVVREVRRAEADPAHGFFPVGLYLLPNIGFPKENWDVGPVRINVVSGRNRDVYGIDVGLVGNMVAEEFTGVQAAGLFNRIDHSDGALQLAGVLNRVEGGFTGLQASAVNAVDGDLEGLQIGLYNRASVLDGMQIGFANIVDSGSGLQLGIVNSARELDGLQIGLVNVIRDSTVPFFPIVNFAF